MSARQSNENILILRSVILFLLTILMSGCSHTCPLKPALDQPPRVSKIPVTVGVYYNSEFSNLEQSRAVMQHRWIVPIGQASVSLFDLALPMIFEKTVKVSTRPPYQDEKQKLVVVIEPTIEEFNFSIPLALGSYSAELTYRFTLYSLDGTPFASWTVTGEGKRGVGLDYLTHAAPVGEATDMAMQDAVKKFLSGIKEEPEVKSWLRRVGQLETK